MTSRPYPPLPIRHRAVWGLADQVVSSATNFALSIFVARSVGPAEFGAFALALSSYVVIGGVGQALASQPLAVRFSASAAPVFQRAAAEATGTALALGLVAGALSAIVGALAPGGQGYSFVVLGLALPGLLLQDSLRFAFVVNGRPKAAAANDVLWALIQSVGFALALSTDRRGAAYFLAAWGVAGSVAGLVGAWRAKLLPLPHKTFAWLRAHRDLAPRYAAETLIVRGSTFAVFGSVGVLAGFAALGAMRGAQLLYGPLSLLYQGGFFVAVPEAVRAAAHSKRQFKRLVNGVTIATTCLAVLWTLPLWFIPASLGRDILGTTWDSAHELILLFGVQNAAIGLSMGPQIGLRALAAASTSLAVQVLQAAVVVVASSIGSRIASAIGATAGFTIGTLIGAIAWWGAFLANVDAAFDSMIGSGRAVQ